jgi:Amt family ammonium transporter
LDVVGVHGVGGLVGILLLSIFASSAWGGSIQNLDIARQLGVQAFAASVVILHCAIVSWVILKIIDPTVGLRVREDEENAGLNLTHHGETGYDL